MLYILIIRMHIIITTLVVFVKKYIENLTQRRSSTLSVQGCKDPQALHFQHSNGNLCVHRCSWVSLATRYWIPGESGSGYQAKSVRFLRWYSEIPFYCASNRHNMLNYRILLKLYYMKTLINALPNSLSNTFTQTYLFYLFISCNT